MIITVLGNEAIETDTSAVYQHEFFFIIMLTLVAIFTSTHGVDVAALLQVFIQYISLHVAVHVNRPFPSFNIMTLFWVLIIDLRHFTISTTTSGTEVHYGPVWV